MRITNNYFSTLLSRFLRLKSSEISELSCSDVITPVFLVNQTETQDRIGVHGVLNNATSATIVTTPTSATGRKWILTGVHITWQKDVTATATLFSLNAAFGGASVVLAAVDTLTLTVGQGSTYVPLNIRVDDNTTITLNSDTNVGNFRVGATVFLINDNEI